MKLPWGVPLALLIVLATWVWWPAPVDASPATEAAQVWETVPAQSACSEQNTMLFVTATDGGDVRYTLGDGGALGGVALSNSPSDGVMVINNSPVPLRCRATNAPQPKSTKGVTICNTTSCDFSGGKARTRTNPATLTCVIPAINRDAGQLTFQAITQTGCRQ